MLSRIRWRWGILRDAFEQRTHLGGRSVARLHFKLAVLVWAIAYGVNPPAATIDALQVVLYVQLVTTAVGAVVSSTGLVIGVQPNDRRRKLGVEIELGGLWLMLVGPLIYMSTQLVFFFQQQVENWEVRFGVGALGWALSAAVVLRIVEVVPRYRRLHAPAETHAVAATVVTDIDSPLGGDRDG